MQHRADLTLAEANRLGDAGQRAAHASGLRVAIAVVDAGGHLIMLRRLPGAPATGSETSRHKARTAALARRPSQHMEDMINGGRLAFLSVPGLSATMTGGLPVLRDGVVVGAIGVSGARPDQDVDIGQAALAAFADQ